MSNKKKSVKSATNCTVASNDSQSAELPLSSQSTDKCNASKKRKLHKAYTKGWSEDIAKNGFSRCIIASCNFISSNISSLQEHHKTCSGLSLNGETYCEKCESYLPTNEEFTHHKTICKGLKKVIIANISKRTEDLENQNREQPTDSQNVTEHPEIEDENNSNVQVQNLFCCVHCKCGFSTKEDHLKHLESCSPSNTDRSPSKKTDSLHFRVIKQMKNKESSDDHIVQPGPDPPKGQYRRRRAYRAEHKNSWALTLEKFKYVKCIYQNCYFIAMSLEDMIAHFGYCNGDGSFAKFICPYCKGRVTSEAILLKHIQRSHPLETPPIKIEPEFDGNSYEDQNLESPNLESEEANETSKSPKTTCKREIQTKELGFESCPNCNFNAPNAQELETHLKQCDETPEGQLLKSPKRRRRSQTEKEPKNSKNDGVKHLEKESGKSKRTEEEDLEIGPVVRQYKGKRPKNRRSSETDKTGSETPGGVKQKSRRRSRKTKEEKKTKEEEEESEMTCAKCSFRCSKGAFACHNLKKHYGLGWMVGEEPVDENDEKLLIRLVKEAFKYTKKATCEKCDVVKKSVLGFVSHIQICGKSNEEKDALKVQCPHCDGKYLRYSLGSHIKLTHSVPDEEVEEEEKPKEEEEEVEKTEEALDLSGKRRSAIRAVSKFQQALNDNDEPESNRETNYVFYEKGSERVPKLNSKLNNLWYKLKRENKKIPCRHPNCKNLSSDVREAKSHHYSCPSLPEKVFLCELCDFYSENESTVKIHLKTHRKYVKQHKKEEEVKLDEEENEDENDDGEETGEDEEEEEEETRSSEGEPEDGDEGRKRKKKKSGEKPRKKMKLGVEDGKPDGDVESRLKQNFCRREKIDNVRGMQFYSSGLDMTLQEELATSESTESWSELNTKRKDWRLVPEEQLSRYLPELTESVPVRFAGNETTWRKFRRFESDLIGGVPVMFAGASVRSMSWCRISFRRMLKKMQKQYLAVATPNRVDRLRDIYEKSAVDKPNLLQIWDCGTLNNELAKTPPKLALGIVHEGGEIWDLAWFPQDTQSEATDESLRRLGLLATACEDGAVRIWSVCDPDQLNTIGFPVYQTEPVAILTVDAEMEESCLRLSVGLDGIVAGGYGNGTIAVWNLKNASSPFCKKSGKCSKIRAHLVFQAHKTAVTALTFCPLSNRYISTGGLDRFVKVWDLEFPSVPVEQSNKECSLDNVWTLNWPSVIYNFDDVVVNFNKGTVKFIKDVLTDRHQSTFAMEDSCLSFSFSDWLNALCGGSITGEVKLRLLKNLIHDQKKSQSTITTVKLEKLKEGEIEKGKNFPTSYNEAATGFGLVFKDSLGMDKKRPEKPRAHPEEFPIRAVNKIEFNPNFKCFTHIALGYNCGLIRIHPLKELQTTRSLKFLLQKVEKNF